MLYKTIIVYNIRLSVEYDPEMSGPKPARSALFVVCIILLFFTVARYNKYSYTVRIFKAYCTHLRLEATVQILGTTDNLFTDDAAKNYNKTCLNENKGFY